MFWRLRTQHIVEQINAGSIRVSHTNILSAGYMSFFTQHQSRDVDMKALDVVYRSRIKTTPRIATYMVLSGGDKAQVKLYSRKYDWSGGKENKEKFGWDACELYALPFDGSKTEFRLRLPTQEMILKVKNEDVRDKWVQALNLSSSAPLAIARRNKIWSEKKIWSLHVHLQQGSYFVDPVKPQKSTTFKCTASIDHRTTGPKQPENDMLPDPVTRADEDGNIHYDFGITTPLRKRDMEKSSGGCKLLHPVLHSTQLITHDVTPVWNEMFGYSAVSESSSLVLEVLNRKGGYLGTCRVKIGDVVSKGYYHTEKNKLEGCVSLESWLDAYDEGGLESCKTPGRVLVKLILQPAPRCHDLRLSLDRSLFQIPGSITHKFDFEARLRVWHCTWNMGNKSPPSEDKDQMKSLLFEVLNTDADPHVVAVGVQECEYEAKKGSEAHFVNILGIYLGTRYRLIKYNSLWAIRLVIFVRCDVYEEVSCVRSTKVATGIANTLGNKGGVLTSFKFRHTSLCFWNSHLAAHQNKTRARNENIRDIIKSSIAGIGNGVSDVSSQFHYVFMGGDLNYRLDYGEQGDEKSPNDEDFYELSYIILKNLKLGHLHEVDQLRKQMEDFGILYGFKEANPPTFAPTFKVERNKYQLYNPKRSPAWTDRVLIKTIPGLPPVTPIEYDASFDVLSSDHKPVHAIFDIQTWFNEAVDELCGVKIVDCKFTELLLADMVQLIPVDGALTARITSDCFEETVIQQLDVLNHNITVDRVNVKMRYPSLKRLKRTVLSFEILHQLESLGHGCVVLHDIMEQKKLKQLNESQSKLEEAAAAQIDRIASTTANSSADNGLDPPNPIPTRRSTITGEMDRRSSISVSRDSGKGRRSLSPGPYVSRSGNMSVLDVARSRVENLAADPVQQQRARKSMRKSLNLKKNQHQQVYQTFDIDFKCPITLGGTLQSILKGRIKLRCQSN